MHNNKKAETMKKTILCVAACLAFVACEKSLPYQDVLYFTGTETTPETSLYVDGPTDVSFTVTSSSTVKEDTRVTVAIDPEGVNRYNTINGTSYQMLPAGSYALVDADVTIKAKSNVSSSFTLSVLSQDDFEDGVTYCVPFKIASTDGVAQPLKDGQYMYAIAKSVIHTKGVDFNRQGYLTVPSMMYKTSVSDLGACTMEIRVKPEGWSTTNPYISTLIGVEENFLLRFGDISCDNNQLQLAGRGVSITSKTHFNLNTWYHIAVVDDGNTARLYVDGELDTEVSSAGKDAINLASSWAGGFHIGYSADNGRKLDGILSEARVWNRALSPVELVNNQCIISDPVKAAQNDALLAYWKLDACETNAGTTVFKDLTGNGYDAILSSTYSFVEGVSCPILDK